MLKNLTIYGSLAICLSLFYTASAQSEEAQSKSYRKDGRICVGGTAEDVNERLTELLKQDEIEIVIPGYWDNEHTGQYVKQPIKTVGEVQLIQNLTFPTTACVSVVGTLPGEAPTEQ